MAESTCAGCGLTFTGLTAFDRHLDPLNEHPYAVCCDPRDRTLVAKVRERGGKRRTVWGFPAPDGAPWAGDAA